MRKTVASLSSQLDEARHDAERFFIALRIVRAMVPWMVDRADHRATAQIDFDDRPSDFLRLYAFRKRNGFDLTIVTETSDGEIVDVEVIDADAFLDRWTRPVRTETESAYFALTTHVRVWFGLCPVAAPQRPALMAGVQA